MLDSERLSFWLPGEVGFDDTPTAIAFALARRLSMRNGLPMTPPLLLRLLIASAHASRWGIDCSWGSAGEAFGAGVIIRQYRHAVYGVRR